MRKNFSETILFIISRTINILFNPSRNQITNTANQKATFPDRKNI
tara:strand:- start:165 stop:299 length:135 start_codon:yes stop_codon:yes gene_type:complete